MKLKLEKIKSALLKVTDNVGHYEALDKTDKYIVWAEDNESDSTEADNKKINQSIQGTIDYFTKEEYDDNVDKIQEEIIASHISFRLNSVQYEDETGYIHYEWIFEV